MASEKCSHHDCNCAVNSRAYSQNMDEMDFERGIWSAALNGELKRVQKIIDKGTNPNDLDSSGYTALHYACRSGHTDICELLLREGANVNAQTRSGKVTPLHRAVYCGHENIVNILLESGAEPMLADNDGQTALHKAAANGNVHIVERLLESCQKLKDINDNRNRQAWELASSHAVVKMLKPH